MEKLVYLVHKPADHSGSDLRSALLGPVTAALYEGGASKIVVNINDEDVAAGEKVLIRKSPVPIRAVVSFWMNNCDDRAACEAALSKEASELHGYLVLESVPTLNTEQPAPAGERTPGANLITCIKKKPGIDYGMFRERWYIEHKEVARTTQSTFAYVRNTVVRPVTDGAPDWDGIVEESFPIEALTDPHVWYDTGGDSELLGRRIKGMVASVDAFLDLSVLESTPMSEYRLG